MYVTKNQRVSHRNKNCFFHNIAMNYNTTIAMILTDYSEKTTGVTGHEQLFFNVHTER